MPTAVPQAAVLAVRNGEICMVTSRRKKRWVFPKGRIERGQAAPDAAAAEAWEEAGLDGTIDPDPIGTYRYEKEGKKHMVTVFLMLVSLSADQWPELSSRTREWVSVATALERIEEPDLRAIVSDVASRSIAGLRLDCPISG